MQTYTIYIMRVSGLKQARGLRKIGVARCVEHRRQSIENSLRKNLEKIALFISNTLTKYLEGARVDLRLTT